MAQPYLPPFGENFKAELRKQVRLTDWSGTMLGAVANAIKRWLAAQPKERPMAKGTKKGKGKGGKC
jgi:hypothetical protein